MRRVRIVMLAVTCVVLLHAGAGCRPAAEGARLSSVSAVDEWTPVRLETLTGRTWMLREWDVGEAAPTEPRITLRYDAGRFTGTSGCNRYNGTVTPGSSPGAIAVGAIAGTRMMCPEPVAGIEGRFLAALPRAQAVHLRDGRLRITYAGPKGAARLVFDEIRAVAS